MPKTHAMKRILAALLAALLFFPVTPLLAKDWGSIVRKVQLSSVVIEATNQKPICSGFVIAKHTVLSANHCWHDGQITVDGKLMEPLWYDVNLDLMVLSVPELKKPVIKFRGSSAYAGMEVMAVGHGYGSRDNFHRTGNVAVASGLLPRHMMMFLISKGRDPYLPHLMLDFDVIGGMSGGMIVDNDGQVVTLVQMGDGYTAFSIAQSQLKSAIKKFL